MDSDSPNNTQSRACARCRSYKFRLYHPGRLKYPLKQTKKRGDLSGFVRISWDEALNEISRKHKAITTKYGNESFFLNYACGAYSSGWQGGSFTGLWSRSNSAAGNLLGGFLSYYNNYSFHQQGFFGTGYTGYAGMNANANSVAGFVKNIVLWGSNALSTVNPSAYPEIRSIEEMKKRGGKVTFIGPEFVDTGVTLADTWVQMKPYTDTAVLLAMIHHLITNTIDDNGNVRTDVDSSLQLDLNYIDTAVYGFFDSPEYWLETLEYTDGTDVSIGTTPNSNYGVISHADPQTGWTKTVANRWIKDSDGSVVSVKPSPTTGYTAVTEFWVKGAQHSYVEPSRKVPAVPAGKSLSAYIMGRDDRLTKAAYSGNYTALAFAPTQPNRNASTCSYTATAGAATQYQTKKDYSEPKTPEWAEKISGVPAQAIKDLAELYINPANHPIYSEWCGAQQKQAEGVINMFALQAMLVLTKTWGQTGDGLGRAFGGKMNGATGSLSVSINRPGVPSKIEAPVPSCTVWHCGVKFAFGDQLKAGGYTGKYIPDWNDSDKASGKTYFDDGGAKALVKWKRNGSGNIETDAEGYYVPENDGGGKPIYSGIRFILNPGGNILINQHMNSNDSRDMFEALEIASKNPDDPDTLCVVAVDNFLSPTPRWSDYILPAATTWEQEDIIGIDKGNSLYIPVVTPPPGESKSMWNFTNEWLKAYEKVDSSKAGIATKFTGGIPNQQVEDRVKASFITARNTPASPYYKKSWEEFLDNPYLPKIADDTPVTAPTKLALRTNLETYLADSDNIATTPFIKSGNSTSITTSDASGGFGNQYIDATSGPNPSMRFQVYSPVLVWQYEHRYEKWHGYLPADERGQANKDIEGDALVYPIPMYFAYEDYFKEAYGVMNGKNSLPENPLLLTTTHDRFRAHSSQSENPYLRELTHRVKGGKLYSGNDWNEYALISEGKAGETFPRLNKAVQDKKANATWSEIWMNDEDAAARGIVDGDLVLVKNPIGAVRCIARVTTRCVKGMTGLHQGCWYDPAEDGVDDGGNCNTLMASRPSRVDHGNGQQSAMVSITKVN